MRGLILFAHGARDARWAEPFERLRAGIALSRPEVPVELAYLELMSPTLTEAAGRLIDRGCHALTVVPVFLGQGGHMRRDLPALVAELRARYPALPIACAAAAGEDATVLRAIADYCLQCLDQ